MPPFLRSRVRTDKEWTYLKTSFMDSNNTLYTYDFPQYPYITGQHFEDIQDVVGAKGKFNPVHHVKVRGSFQIPSQHQFYDKANTHGLVRVLSATKVSFDPSTVSQGGMIQNPSPALLSNWSYEAYNKFREQIPMESSVANFLFELRDIKGLIPKVSKQLSKTASSNFLALEFGWKPMIGDIKKIWSLSEAVSKRIEFLRANRNKPMRLQFSRTIPEPVLGGTVEQICSSGLEGTKLQFRRFSYSGKFTITAKLRQNVDLPDFGKGSAMAFAAAAGFNNPAAIVWEAIPYSFVIDWFFHLDSLIQACSIQPFAGQWDMTDVGYSVADTSVYGVYMDFDYYGTPATWPYIGQVDVQRFGRLPGFPMTFPWLTGGTLDPKQQVLALALLDQRR